MIKLQLMFKDGVVKEFLTDKSEITIGRDPGNDLCIVNVAASSHHARLFKGPDNRYAIEDLSSTNGTYVNGMEIRTRILQNNDEVTIAKHTILVTYQGDDALKEEQANRISGSTYMLSPEERKKLME